MTSSLWPNLKRLFSDLKRRSGVLNDTLRSGAYFVLDILFPKYCVICQKEGSHVCADCFNRASNSPSPPLKDFIIAGSYKNYYLKEIIHSYKYRHIQELAEQLSLLLIQAIRRKFKPDFFTANDAILVPVPLHRRKLRQRGFNQSMLLAEKIGKHFNIPIHSALKKIKSTPAQMILSQKSQRLDNLKNAFARVDKISIKEKVIFLIDDVTTTGATLNECAKVLRQAGAKKIFKIAIAGE